MQYKHAMILALLIPQCATALQYDGRMESYGGFAIWDQTAGEFWCKLGGLLQADGVQVGRRRNVEETGFGTSANMRRARIELAGGVGDFWEYKMATDFSRLEQPIFEEAYVAYNGGQNVSVRFGQFVVSTSMDQMMAAKHRMTMESPMPTNVLSFPDSLGMRLDAHGETFGSQWALFVPGDGVANGAWADFTGSDLLSYVGRAWFNPIHDRNGMIHLGTSFTGYFMHARNNALVYAGQPELHGRDGLWPLVFSSNRLTDNSWTDPNAVGILADTVDSIKQRGYEIAMISGPVSGTAEYVDVQLSPRAGFGALRYQGWYVNASYMTTGETKTYNAVQGVIEGVKPRDAGGALELFTQYSVLSLRHVANIGDDGGTMLYGPVAHTWILGLNWYATERVRMTAEYMNMNFGRLDPLVEADGDTVNTGFSKRNINMIGVRAQAAW